MERRQKLFRIFLVAVAVASLYLPVATLNQINDFSLSSSSSQFGIYPTLLREGSNATSQPSYATKILGFASFDYREDARSWYQELEHLGYNEHWLIAMDSDTFGYCQKQNMRCKMLEFETPKET